MYKPVPCLASYEMSHLKKSPFSSTKKGFPNAPPLLLPLLPTCLFLFLTSILLHPLHFLPTGVLPEVLISLSHNQTIDSSASQKQANPFILEFNLPFTLPNKSNYRIASAVKSFCPACVFPSSECWEVLHGTDWPGRLWMFPP